MKIKNNLTILIMSVFVLFSSAVQAVNIDALCFLPTDDINELVNGDQVRLKSNHVAGPVWLTWFMDVYTPDLQLKTLEPQAGEMYNRFTYEKIMADGRERTRYYITSPYEGIKYYLSCPVDSNVALSRLDAVNPNSALWRSYIHAYDNTTFGYANPDQIHPVGLLMSANHTSQRPVLTQYNFGGGANWTLELGHSCTVIYNVTSDWGTGYNATITVENNTGHPITDWELVMSYSYDIDSISNAVIKSRDGVRYVIENAGWNSTIQPASSVTFYISGNVGNLQFDPWNCTVVNN
jgi:hypothetical protein